jgi:hypothetical protein
MLDGITFRQHLLVLVTLYENVVLTAIVQRGFTLAIADACKYGSLKKREIKDNNTGEVVKVCGRFLLRFCSYNVRANR